MEFDHLTAEWKHPALTTSLAQYCKITAHGIHKSPHKRLLSMLKQFQKPLGVYRIGVSEILKQKFG